MLMLLKHTTMVEENVDGFFICVSIYNKLICYG
jgi:hypothetical protein